MEGHFGECFNEDMVLRIALESFVDAGAAPGGQHSLTLFTHTHTHTRGEATHRLLKSPKPGVLDRVSYILRSFYIFCRGSKIVIVARARVA